MKREISLFSFTLTLILLLAVFSPSDRAAANNNAGKSPVSSPEYLSLPMGQATSGDLFNGTVYLSQLVGRDKIFNSPSMFYVVFEPGVINKWHNHAGGQILIAIDGVGYHQIEGQPVEALHPGDVVKCPPGVKHWHGATADGWFSHIAIETNPEKQGFEMFDFITEAEYNTLPKK
jgi:quercetin dioxygenase-like cupin family protein